MTNTLGILAIIIVGVVLTTPIRKFIVAYIAQFWSRNRISPLDRRDQVETHKMGKVRSDVEKQLQTRDMQLKALINAMPDYVVIRDGSLRWLMYNDKVLDLFGLDKNRDYTGMTNHEVVQFAKYSTEKFHKYFDYDSSLFTEQKSKLYEDIIQSSDGDRHYKIIRAPLLEEGTVTGTLVIGLDITEEKNAVKALKSLDPNLLNVVNGRVTLERELAESIGNCELFLRYQPQYDSKAHRVVGFEALVTWNHPVRGIVPPSEFITLAEESGLIIDIGNWILYEACRMAKKWNDKYAPLKMAVNISPRQFEDPNLLNSVRSILSETGFDPVMLELEITEGIIMKDGKAAKRTIEQFRELGIRIAIDDFGTGYSSLLNLKNYTVDKLKIDKAFIDDIAKPGNHLAFPKAMITLAQELNLQIIAEGVETNEQLRMLQSLGCHQVQGYLFGKPVPSEETEKLLDRL